jgi:hypothetical protein
MPPVVQGQAVARQADDIARAQSEAAKAAELSKAAAAQKTSQFQTGVNPLAAVAAAGNAAPGVTALLQGQGQDQDQGGFDTGGFEDIGQQMGTSGVQDLQQMQAQAPETTGGKGGLESLFTNPLFLMGARMMAGTSPFAMQNIGQAGVGTASDLLAQRRAEREEDYYSALAQRARALSKTEGLTGNTQLAYYLGEGETPEKRVKSGFNVLKALESSGDAFKHLEAFERTNMQREEKGLKPRSFADYWKQFQGFTMRAPAPIDTATNIRP